MKEVTKIPKGFYEVRWFHIHRVWSTSKYLLCVLTIVHRL